MAVLYRPKTLEDVLNASRVSHNPVLERVPPVFSRCGISFHVTSALAEDPPSRAKLSLHSKPTPWFNISLRAEVCWDLEKGELAEPDPNGPWWATLPGWRPMPSYRTGDGENSNGLSLDAWCRAAQIYEESRAVSARLLADPVLIAWFRGDDPSDYRADLERFFPHVRFQLTGDTYRAVHVRPSDYWFTTWLQDEHAVREALVLRLIRRTISGPDAAKIPKDKRALGWGLTFKGLPVISSAWIPVQGTELGKVALWSAAQPASKQEEDAVFERIHKVACPRCKSQDFGVMASTEAKLRAEIRGGRVVYQPGPVSIGTATPQRFCCTGCSHEWPIPETLLGSVVEHDG